jgi:hypothetical protein
VSLRSVRRILVVAIACTTAPLACGDDSPSACIAFGGAPVVGAGAAAGAGGRGGAAGAATSAGGAAGSTGGGGGNAAAAVRGGSGGGGTGGGAGRGGNGGGSTAGAGGGGRGGTSGTAGSAGSGGAGGTGGSPQVATPGYSGCSHTGGVDRIRVTKFQSPSGLCFDVELSLTTKAPPAGLTLPQNWTLTSAIARPCAVVGAPTAATGATGSIDWPPQIGFLLPPTVNLDVTLAFAGGDAGVPANERLNGQNVDIRTACAP